MTALPTGCSARAATPVAPQINIPPAYERKRTDAATDITYLEISAK